jgi:transposase InsO family protein
MICSSLNREGRIVGLHDRRTLHKSGGSSGSHVSLDDAQRKCEAWRRDYNEERLHSVIGNKPPIDVMNRSRATARPWSNRPEIRSRMIQRR